MTLDDMIFYRIEMDDFFKPHRHIENIEKSLMKNLCDFYVSMWFHFF